MLDIIERVWSERQRVEEKEPKDFSQLSHTFNSVLILGLTISSSTFSSFHNFFPFASLTILNMLGPVKDKKTTFCI